MSKGLASAMLQALNADGMVPMGAYDNEIMGVKEEGQAMHICINNRHMRTVSAFGGAEYTLVPPGAEHGLLRNWYYVTPTSDEWTGVV